MSGSGGSADSDLVPEAEAGAGKGEVEVESSDDDTVKASPSSQDFYAKAKKSIWSQAAALGTIGFLHAAIVAVRHLTVVGRGTPLLFNVLEYESAFVAFSVFAFFTSFSRTSERSEAGASRPRPKFPKAIFRVKTVDGVAKNIGPAAVVPV